MGPAASEISPDESKLILALREKESIVGDCKSPIGVVMHRAVKVLNSNISHKSVGFIDSRTNLTLTECTRWTPIDLLTSLYTLIRNRLDI